MKMQIRYQKEIEKLEKQNKELKTQLLLKSGNQTLSSAKLRKIKVRADMKSDLVWISNGPKEVGFQMFWTLNGIWAQPFEIWTNGRRFVKKHLKSGHKCPDFEWLGL